MMFGQEQVVSSETPTSRQRRNTAKSGIVSDDMEKTCCKLGDGGVSLSCRTSLSRLKKSDCRTENGDECKEGYR
ncbi:unnamed protein product [Gadus morhua 'NCC']